MNTRSLANISYMTALQSSVGELMFDIDEML